MNTLDDIRGRIKAMPGPDDASMRAAIEREPTLTKPPGALGRLEEISSWVSAWQGRHPASASSVGVCVFAGNHGVTAQGVSAFPPEVTAQMVGNFQAGGAAINQLCELQGFSLKVLDVAVGTPTKDFYIEPAMSEEEFVRAFNLGYDAVDKNWQVLCVGEMGIGNTTSAAAICLGLFEGDAVDWTGPGTGVAGATLEKKSRIVAEAVAMHRPKISDGLDVLRFVGGLELVAIAGAVLGAREARIPVILDGYTCTAAAAAIRSVNRAALDHCKVGHQSAEPGHLKLIRELGEEPILSLNMRLGEGTGAALAVAVVRGALACHNGMSTFDDAGVSNKD